MSDNLTIPSPIGYRPPRRQNVMMTPETQRKLLIAGGILGALVVVAGIGTWIGRSTGDIPVILPDERPIRVKPDDPGGMKVAGIENSLYAENDSQGATRLAAAPEVPNPLALRAPPEPPAQPAKDAVTATPVQDAGGPRATTPPATAKPQAPAAAPRTTGPQAATPPARTPAQEPPRPATAAPPPATAATTTAPRPDAKPASGRVSVQLAAVQSEGAAQAEWQALRLRHPDLFGARSSAISKTERDGKTFWRVRTAGFTDLAEARAFCERVRAKGAACNVAES